MAQHGLGGPGSQHVAIVDAVPAGQHRVDHRHGLVPHVGSARGVAQVDMRVEQSRRPRRWAKVAGAISPALATSRSSSKVTRWRQDCAILASKRCLRLGMNVAFQPTFSQVRGHFTRIFQSPKRTRSGCRYGLNNLCQFVSDS